MWPVTRSDVRYQNPWISVREDAVVRPDGSPGIFGVVSVRNASIFVVALSDDDEVWLVTVDRHTVGPSIEVPAGGCDGEDPLLAARRELAEETGLSAEQWTPIGRMNALNGICEAPEHVFLARGLSRLPLAADEQQLEGIRAAGPVAWVEVLRMVREGLISDGETIAALMFAALELGRIG